MTNIILLEQDEFTTIKTALHDAKILLERNDINFDIRQALYKLEDIIEILEQEM